MALGFSAWFLTALVLGLPERRRGWLAVAAACGVGAALVKVTTFLVWCLPAGAFCAVQLWPEWESPGRTRFIPTLAWIATATLPAFVSAIWWVRFSDSVKRLNFDGSRLLTSSELAGHNFGHWHHRFDPATWDQLLHQWHTAVMPLWLVALLAVAALFMRSAQRLVAWGLGVFIAALLIFPVLYSLHDYYFYAAGVFWLGAAGSILIGALDGPLPRPVFWLLLAALIAGNLNAYRTAYYPSQQIDAAGGTGLTDALGEVTPAGTVLIIAGDDWSAAIPYYSHRRAFMIRSGLEQDWPGIEASYANLRGEEIGALVLVGSQRANHELVERTVARFNLDPAITFSHPTADVYLNKDFRQSTLLRLAGNHNYNEIVPRAKPEQAAAHQSGPERHAVTPAVAASTFAQVAPAPTFYRFTYGIIPMELDGVAMVGAHPDSELWVPPPPHASHVVWEFGMLPASYEREGDKTDGVEQMLFAEDAAGHRRQIFRRVLDPLHVPGDRGRQHAEISYDYRPGETLVFVSGPSGNASYDWTYWARIEVR
ncbi:MAG TPA: hypothetical protein VFJ90_04805 [Candidatus Didemnitutus sp.]|nr:hypothetical protein [Candidatus Didemnitutus sp.]